MKLLKDSISKFIYETVYTTSDAVSKIREHNLHPENVRAFEAKKDGRPCKVTFYCCLSSNEPAKYTAIVLDDGFNIGYSGEGPSRLFDILNELGFINSENKPHFENLIYNCQKYIYFDKENPNLEIFK